MHNARISLVALLLLVLPVPARAQESLLDGFKTQAKAQPNDPAAALALGRAYRRAGRTQKALGELRRGVNLARGSALDVLHWEIARTHIAQSEFGLAMVQCRVVGALPGGTAAGHACAAEAHLLWKRASEALVETGLALANGSKSYEAKVAEGTARELEVKLKEAETSYREAIAYKPDQPDAHVALGRLLVRQSGSGGAGLRELRDAARLDPTNPEAAYELGAALGANPEAVALLARATKERTSYAAAERKLAEFELALGHVPEAEAAARAALKSDPRDAWTHVLHGRILLTQNKPDEAIRAAESALKVLANSAAAKLLLGDAYTKKGEIDLAAEAYQSAHGLDSTDPTPLIRAAEACRAAGRFTSARAFGMKATIDFPTWGPAWVAYGDALVADGERENAKKAYETALRSKGPVDAASVTRKISAIR